ncbi:MAG: glycoside hydrolase family 3 protein, partial [Pseudomonadota bacterium]|nr:glycoside hydrolase family 3 protein [Pseudomonadota bacterium]
MKAIIKLVVRVLIIAVVLAALYAVNLFLKPVSKMKASFAQSSIAAPINVDGEAFRDLNRNGSLDPYEDHRVA